MINLFRKDVGYRIPDEFLYTLGFNGIYKNSYYLPVYIKTIIDILFNDALFYPSCIYMYHPRKKHNRLTKWSSSKTKRAFALSLVRGLDRMGNQEIYKHLPSNLITALDVNNTSPKYMNTLVRYIGDVNSLDYRYNPYIVGNELSTHLADLILRYTKIVRLRPKTLRELT